MIKIDREADIDNDALSCGQLLNQIIRIILLYNQMLAQNQNFVNINYQRGKGLILDWNFKDILGRDKFFRHLVVILNSETQQVYCFVESFYKRMKFGDLFCCLYAKDNGEVKQCRWIQKTHLNKFKAQSYLKQISTHQLQQNIKAELMDLAACQTPLYSDYMVVTLLLAHEDRAKVYKQIVQERRLNRGQFAYIVNIFGKKQDNQISIYKGINIFKWEPHNISQYTQFYHYFINSAAIPFANIKITSENGQIGLFHQQNWKNRDFHTVQANYYGPSSQFKFDRLFFYFQDFRRSIDLHFKVTLSLKLFSGKQYRSVKKLHLNYSYEKDVSVSMRQAESYNYIIFKDIVVKEDPYQCSTILRISYKNENHLALDINP